MDELYGDYQEITDDWSPDVYWNKVDELIVKDIEEVLTRYYEQLTFCCEDLDCQYQSLKIFIEEILF